MSFLTCKLIGGLGNQLFQIATFIANALETNTEYFLIENNPDFTAMTGNNPSKYYNTIYKKISKRLLPDGVSIQTYNEPKFSYTNFINVVHQCKNNNIGVILRGYFQSELYFEKHKETIKTIFTPEEGLEEYIRKQTNLFSMYSELDPKNTTDTKKRAFIGVRRGDYVKHSEIHNPVSMNYYSKAMSMVNADYYYIVSDDIEWCKTQFIGPQFIFFEEPDDLRTFFFARLFKTYICANSTFHWWSSYLSIYPNPVVYAPKEHFGPKGPQDYQDYFRKDMILISNLNESQINISNKQDSGIVVNEPFTLVTAYYEMKSKHTIERMLQWIQPFFSMYPGYMVIYTEEKYMDIFMKMRGEYNTKTRIICTPRSSWSAVNDFPSDFWEKQHNIDPEKSIHSPELYKIWYQKNEFVQKTIQLNPFNHTKFMWCDAGILRYPSHYKYMASMIHGERILKNKISILEIEPFTSSDLNSKEPVNFQHYYNNRVGAGIITGGVEAWIQWDKHYKEMIKEFTNRNWFMGKEQNIFANMVLRWPQDVHVVKPIKNIPSFDYWFYMIYYYGCDLEEFLLDR